MRSRTVSPLLDDQERMSVLVTEMLKLGTAADARTRAAVRQILAALLDAPEMADEDRRLAATLLRESPSSPAT